MARTPDHDMEFDGEMFSLPPSKTPDHDEEFASTGGVGSPEPPPSAAERVEREFDDGEAAHAFMADLSGTNFEAHPERYTGEGDVLRRGKLQRMPMSFNPSYATGDVGGSADDAGNVEAVKSGAKFGPSSQNKGMPIPHSDAIFGHEMAHRKRKGLTRALDYLGEWEDHGFSNNPVDIWSVMLENAHNKLGINFESDNYEDDNARAEELLVQLMGLESVLKSGMSLKEAGTLPNGTNIWRDVFGESEEAYATYLKLRDQEEVNWSPALLIQKAKDFLFDTYRNGGNIDTNKEQSIGGA